MLTLKLISEETERVVKGLEKKCFPNAREAVEKVPVSYTHLDVYKRQEARSPREIHGRPSSTSATT